MIPVQLESVFIHRPAACPYPCPMTAAQGHAFNWTLAIARNRAALLRIVAVLFVYAGLDGGRCPISPLAGEKVISWA